MPQKSNATAGLVPAGGAERWRRPGSSCPAVPDGGAAGGRIAGSEDGAGDVAAEPAASLDITADRLDPAIAAWLRRSGEVAAALGMDDAAAPVRRRAWQQTLGDRLFAAFGRPGPSQVVIATHRIDGPAGALRVREYRPLPGRRAGPDPAGRAAACCYDPSDHAAGAAGAGAAGAEVAGAEVAGADRLTRPAYLTLHGGAFWLGSIDDRPNAAAAAERALGADAIVFDVDYRLAPEHPFPAGLEDCYTALVWVHAHAAELAIDPARIVVGGVSAGGNLAAALCRLVRDRGGPPIRGQLLEVPVLDLRADGAWIDRYAAINGLDGWDEIRDFYLRPGQDPADPLVSPLAGADLGGLPPAHIITAEIDPLRAGGEAYAVALRRAGVRATATRRLGALHGANALTGTWSGARLWAAEAIAALAELTL
ncbi:MAG: alpha/beta hydrolase [Bifidobacteriaceae bacterium]|jgi:acetyl esterase|nr:alpha/beta hydrolase [Bifidobacteriaceae bacterium]